ncbi:hypothetical protein H8A99_05845 [Bradyrhizobium sp. Arg68]|uniref:DUF3322 domain-containing protein n=1 Tax=Bradyrhizobium ivorense TaxID=2511166 RepID=UPI0027E33432|nr:DUF3322 domain-containing protein [Bradyrhizobium ivorense]MCC8936026.1 hypothetical protein [Bradyrhizobium ivorense]
MPDSATGAWTKPAELTDQVRRLWDKGRILAARIDGTPLFPLTLRLRSPGTQAYGAYFEEVRSWIKALVDGSRIRRGFGYDIEWDEVNHRQLGRNRVPRAVCVPTETDALKLISRQNQAIEFDQVLQETKASFPELLQWLIRKPLVALESASDWPRVLAVIAWFKANPRSGLYLRQLDIAGVDTKFIETRKPLLAELLELTLDRPAASLAKPATFEQAYGLRSKPPMIRFRILDEKLAIGVLRDIATPAPQFASLRLAAKRIFITENEINGLAFPDLPNSAVVFGLGYGLELLASAEWMTECEIYYWGDIDTHGFSMLNRVRSLFPRCHSLLMDKATLLKHRTLWGREEVPFRGPLDRLHPCELDVYDALVQNRYRENLRLEQERLSFGHINEALESLIS